MELGDFASEAGGTVAENGCGVGDGFGDAMGSFVEDQSAIFDAEALEGALALPTSSGEKAKEEEFFVGQARSGKSCEEGGRAGDGDDRDVMANGEGDEAMAGIGDERHSGIADECDVGTLLHGEDKFGRAGEFIVLVIADEGFVNLKVVQEL
jgi:hypothetical protein